MKNKWCSFFKKNWIYMVSFGLPWILLVVHSLLFSTWVTGKGSLLRGDMAAQLVPFYYGLWDKVHAGESMAFTWNLAGGCDFQTILGYLISPFTLLVLLVPRDGIVNMVQFVMVSKWSLTACAGVYFFAHTKQNKLKEHRQLVALFLGLAFALGNGIINYMGYIQFMDVMICVPILLLLVERLMEEGKWKGYFLLLTWCMISNAYLTFGVCIFLLIWSILQLENVSGNRIKGFRTFLGASLLAAGTCAGSLLVGLKLAQGRLATETQSQLVHYVKSLLVSPKDFVKQLFVLTPITTSASYDPNIYFSIVGVVLVLFFCVIHINRKKKMYLLGVSVLLLASFFVGAISIVWHCFAVPNGVTHRFSNLFVLWMLCLVLHVMQHLEDIRREHVLCVGLIACGAAFVSFMWLDYYESFVVYLLTALLLVLYFLFLYFFGEGKLNKSQLIRFFAVCGIVELSFNAFFALRTYDRDVFFYEDGNKEVQELAGEVSLENGERLECMGSTQNFGMVVNRPSDSAFFSSINGNNRDLHVKLGMPYSGKVLYNFRGASPVINTMFNVRYAIATDAMLVSDEEVVAQNGNYNLYRMKRLTGLGYMVSDEIKNWNTDGDTCFDVQNNFIRCATGVEEVFHVLEPDNLTCYNMTGQTVDMEQGYPKNHIYAFPYKQELGGEYDSLFVEYVAPQDIKDLYLYVKADWGCYLNVFLDGELKHTDKEVQDQKTLHVGAVKRGQQLILGVIPLSAKQMTVGKDGSLQLVFADFDEMAYDKAYEKMSEGVYHIGSMESDSVTGTISVKESGVMMTSVQALPGFEVLVDGKKTEYVTIADTMIALELDKGTHEISFLYHTPESVLGKWISLFSMVLFAGLCVWDIKKKTSSAGKEPD